MTFILRPALLTSVILLTLFGSESIAAEKHSPLIGTWRLVRFEDTDSKGHTTKQFGDHPRGYFVYDPTGHLSVQIMGVPRIAKFSASTPGDSDIDKGTDAEVRAAYDSYIAYFGTWRINDKGTVVTHIVEGALNPAYTDTDQPRPFKIIGDKLIIEVTNNDRHAYRELQRVR